MRAWKIVGLGLVGSFLGVTLLAGVAWWQDIFTVDRDGTIHFRVTQDGRIGMPNTPDTTALLDLSSTSKGFLMPRMTTAQRDAITGPATGLEVYNTTTNRAERYTGAAWKPVGISNVGGRVYNNVDQSIANVTETALSFNSERFDTDTIHDNVTNNSRLTAKTAGKYLIWGNVSWQQNTSNRRSCALRVNGTTHIARVESIDAEASWTQQAVTTVYNLAVNDYVEVVVYQDSGVSLTVDVRSSYSPEFGMTLLQE